MDISGKIKFEMTNNRNSSNFLCLNIVRNHGEFDVDIFYKPTDGHNYLHYTSSHPRHVKNSVPFNLARRLCSIVQKPDQLELRQTELNQFLRARAYPSELINYNFEKAKNMSSEFTSQNEKSKLTVVFTYNPKNPCLKSYITNAINILKLDKVIGYKFQNLDIRYAYRQPKNLRRMLCHKMPLKNYYSTKCKGTRCEICNIIIEADKIVFKNGKTFNLNANMSCNAKFCIYYIKCQCGSEYIGETEDFRARVNLHKSQIKLQPYRILNCSKHLFNCKNKFNVMPMSQMNNSDLVERQMKEKMFIQLFKPELNR